MKSSFLHLVFLFAAILFIHGCEDDPFNSSREVDFSGAPDPYELSQADTSYTMDNGVEIYIIEEGDGPFETVPRDEISLYFTGRTSDGEIFDSSYGNGSEQPGLIHLSPVSKIMNSTPQATPQDNPIPPRVEGYREGLLGMKEGEKRVIIVPPSLGYNSNELSDETLRYDVELDRIL